MQKPRGPDFGKLVPLMTSVGLDKQSQDYVLNSLLEFLLGGVTYSVAQIEGLPAVLGNLMERAIKKVMERQFDSMSGHTQDIPNFVDLVPEFRESTGQVARDILFEEVDDMNDQKFADIMRVVGEEMANIEGANFSRILELSFMLLSDDRTKNQIMVAVGKSITKGVEEVINRQEVDREITNAAQRALRKGLDSIAEQFYAEGGKGMHGDSTTDVNAWEPTLFTNAVCCMPGMDCWNDNEQGKIQLESELAYYQDQLPWVQAHFDELNLVNVQRQAAELAERFASTRDAAAKLTNQQKTAVKKENAARAALAGLSGAELAAAEAVLDALVAETKRLANERDATDALYAELDKQDAENTVTELNRQLAEKSNKLIDLRAQLEWEQTQYD